MANMARAEVILEAIGLGLLPCPPPHPRCWEMAFQRTAEKQAGGALACLRFRSWEKPRSLCQKPRQSIHQVPSLSGLSQGVMRTEVARGPNGEADAFVGRPRSTWLLADPRVCSQVLLGIGEFQPPCALYHVDAVEKRGGGEAGLPVPASTEHRLRGLPALLMGCTHSAVVRTNSRASSCLIPLRADVDRSSCGLPGPWASSKVTAKVGGGAHLHLSG